jgi:arylamine N-acetyltransferase
VNIVTLPDGSKYVVDVGFGGDGPTMPMPLISEQPMRNLGAQEVRLVYDRIPQQVDKGQKFWIYQYRNGPEREWNSYYCFPGLEFMPEDLVVMNHYTSTYQGGTNFQTRRVLVVRFLRERREIVGKVMLVDGEVKRNLGGRTEMVMVCEREEERIRALGEHFNVSLTAEEVAGINGRNVELVGSE